MRILAIDPGPLESGFVLIDNGEISRFGKESNGHVRGAIIYEEADVVAIEIVSGYGMRVGQETFATCEWIGRFTEAWETVNLNRFKNTRKLIRYKRKEITAHVCDNPSANDSHVREAMIDRWGVPGTKKSPGGTYGFSKDMWSALAIATTAWDLHGIKP